MSLRKSDLAESAALLRAVLKSLLASVGPVSQTAGAELFRQVGALSVGAETAINSASLGAPLFACFEAAYAAGATLTTLGQVRAMVMSTAAVSAAAVEVQQSCLRMCLVEEARVLSRTKLSSRRDVDAYLDRMNAAFEPAETFAADAKDADTFRALVSLHASVSQDLTTRGRPLPRIVTYEFPRSMPALTLANRLYADASRADELIRENGPFNPVFCGRAGTALSA